MLSIPPMKRIYGALLAEHLDQHRQMAFLSGPRQVGKTTTAMTQPRAQYMNWDRNSDRLLIAKGADAIASHQSLDTLSAHPPLLVFDEIHKHPKWKSLLKGFYDVYGAKCRIVVTGSARLNVFRRGGDSLMGRYFLYRMHPLSVAELLSTELREKEIHPPSRLPASDVETLLRFGGFPEPFLKASPRFFNRWSRTRLELLFREDIRDLTRIQEAGRIQVLAELMTHQAGQLVNYSDLATAVGASVDAIRHWIGILETFYYCFTVRPWFRNVAKSLRKQPKCYLWDWSVLPDPGARHENFVATHLLKAVHWWTDIGLGTYELFFLRDKMKREVDFLVVRNNRPWFLVEVKTSSHRDLNPSLAYFQKQTGARHAFQAVFDLDYVDRDCFSETEPVRVPIRTLLSQMV
jgi:hypothetical protein